MFDENDAVLLGITVDNIPTLYAWTQQMGDLWFPVGPIGFLAPW
jgi:peroxiredoxin (alkyl hydroperoxide reductase subunit C)